jgi:neutral ceramidase
MFVMTCVVRAAALGALGVLATMPLARAASPPAAPGLRVGAAVRDITPTADMLPITRAPQIEMTGVLDPLHVRVIALSNGGATTLLVCAETGRSLGPQLARELSRHVGVPLSAILFTATHSHATPEITENWLNLLDAGQRASVPASEQAVVKVTNQQRWAALAQRQLLAAADEAIASMRSASMGIGHAASYINVNRAAVYNRLEDGRLTEYVGLGFNPTGPSDKTLTALRFNDASGKALAFIVNYAVHATVMHGNTSLGGQTGISADIPGLVSTWLEQKYPGSVAVWTSGAAGDQAPLFQNQMLTRDPLTGELSESFSNSYAMLQYLARIHFADVESALSAIVRYDRDAKVNYDYRDARIPGKQGGDYSLSLQVLRIGDVALLGFPGELFSGLGVDIRKSSPLKDTIVVTHAWQRTDQHPGYHADDASIARGGFGTNAAYKPGYLSKALTRLTHDMLAETGRWTFNGDGTATSQGGKRVIVGPDGAAGTADDNQIVNPAGTVLQRNVRLSVAADGVACVPLGSGLCVHAGVDQTLGTGDDLVRGIGRYPQSDVTGTRSDPLEWRLLDIRDGRATLVASSQLDSIQFNLQSADGNDYTHSNLRAWLNSRGGRTATGSATGFYDAAFTPEEKARIVATSLAAQSAAPFRGVNPPFVTDKSHTYRTAAMDVRDPVWVLSGEEAIRYFGPSRLRDESRPADSDFTGASLVPTDYARAKGVKINVGGNGPATVGYGDSWTRTAGATDGKDFYAVFISSLGNLNARRVVSSVYGVLPAITVDLGSKR